MRLAAFIVVLLVAAPALADYKLSARAGASYWPDTANSDEVEASAQPVPLISIGGGYEFEWAPDYAIDVELEATHAFERVQGANMFGMNFLPDDEPLHVTTLMLNVWPRRSISEAVAVYAGGGVGTAQFYADTVREYTMAGQLGAGVTVGLADCLDLDFGYRYVTTKGFKVDGFRLGYDRHAAMVGLQYRFGEP